MREAGNPLTAWKIDKPYGYSITYSNSENPCWLVMRWGVILQTLPTLSAAVKWLEAELKGDHD